VYVGDTSSGVSSAVKTKEPQTRSGAVDQERDEDSDLAELQARRHKRHER
jgi:hypothetical protein